MTEADIDAAHEWAVARFERPGNSRSAGTCNLSVERVTHG